MKILFYIYILLFSLSIISQKKEVKIVDFNNQQIQIQFDDIDLLEITNSDEQRISIEMQDYKENPSQLDIKNNENTIRIVSKKMIAFEPDSKTEKYCYEQPLFPSYKLILPKGCDVDISYKNGNISVQNFKGSLNLRLNTGDVTIANFKGIINAEFFSGNIDATIKNTRVVILSNHGRISTTFPSTRWHKTDISLKGTLGINNNLLKVQSIYANITLNTTETQ